MLFRTRSAASHIFLDQIGQKYDGLLVEVLNVRRYESLFAVRLAYLGPTFRQRESVEIGKNVQSDKTVWST